MSERTESGKPEISIIVPVYQVEKYLNECIDSILAQTFTDFELILVDDGSPDNCPALCDAAAKRDSRVRVIHKQNGGVSTARNAGLDAAQGNWIAFVDSDDTVEPEYLEKMHKAVLETGADFAICSSQCIDETGKTLAGGEHRLLNEFLPQEEVLRRMVVSDFQVPWNKLYRRKLLENLRYPENKAFEDTCLMPVIYARAASACGVWDFLYNYRIVTGSAMHRKTTLKTLDWVEAWYRLFDVLYQNGIRDALCAAYRPILTAVWDIWLHLTPEERKQYDDFYAPIIKEFYQKNPQGKELADWKFQRYMRDYAKVVKTLDDNVGRVLDYLKEKNLLDNTLVVYTSDQGFYMGEHGWFDKRFMYEESMRTPLIMRLPKGFDRKGDITEMVQNIDYAPTFLELAGVPVPEDIHGVSLLPLLKGEHPQNWRNALYYHFYEYPAEHMVKRHYGVRTDRYKLIHFYNDIDMWELYDLQSDPMEMHNLYGQAEYEPVVKELKEELLKLQEQYNDPVRFSPDRDKE